MKETVETAYQRVHLVLEIRRNPFTVEVLVDSARDLLGMGQPEEVQEPRAPRVLDDIFGDLEQELEIGPLGLLRLPGLSDALGQGTGDRSQEVQEGGLKTGVQLEEKSGVGLGSLGAFRQYQDPGSAEVLAVLHRSLQ